MQEDGAAGVEGGSSSKEEGFHSEAEEGYLAELEVALAKSEPKLEERLLQQHHYVLGLSTREEEHGLGKEIGFIKDTKSIDSIGRFLVLPQQDLPIHVALLVAGEPQIDYNQSYILTSDKFIASVEAKATRKQVLLEEARLCKIATKETKKRR
jgi:hypothetical protein